MTDDVLPVDRSDDGCVCAGVHSYQTTQILTCSCVFCSLPGNQLVVGVRGDVKTLRLSYCHTCQDSDNYDDQGDTEAYDCEVTSMMLVVHADMWDSGESFSLRETSFCPPLILQ